MPATGCQQISDLRAGMPCIASPHSGNRFFAKDVKEECFAAARHKVGRKRVARKILRRMAAKEECRLTDHGSRITSHDTHLHILLYQHLHRYIQFRMQLPDHGETELPFSGKDFIDPAAVAQGCL